MFRSALSNTVWVVSLVALVFWVGAWRDKSRVDRIGLEKKAEFEAPVFVQKIPISHETIDPKDLLTLADFNRSALIECEPAVATHMIVTASGSYRAYLDRQRGAFGILGSRPERVANDWQDADLGNVCRGSAVVAEANYEPAKPQFFPDGSRSKRKFSPLQFQSRQLYPKGSLRVQYRSGCRGFSRPGGFSGIVSTVSNQVKLPPEQAHLAARNHDEQEREYSDRIVSCLQIPWLLIYVLGGMSGFWGMFAILAITSQKDGARVMSPPTVTTTLPGMHDSGPAEKARPRAV